MKRTTPTISIVTLTRNRADLLEKNFRSLMGQLSASDEIIIIDNGSRDHTDIVLQKYRHSLPLRVYRQTRGSYPTLYNTGIRHAKNTVVVFLDDDCIAHPSFVKNVRKAHQDRPNVAIQGSTDSIPRGVIYADIMADHYRAFIRSNIMPDGTLRILDNKNASIAKSLLVRVGSFSPKLSAGSEDIELGIRLRRAGIPILLNTKIKAYHHERTTLSGFLTQHLRFARSEKHLDAIVPASERVRLVRWPKLSLQIRYALGREFRYIRSYSLGHALTLPFLYILLACVRIWGYATTR